MEPSQLPSKSIGYSPLLQGLLSFHSKEKHNYPNPHPLIWITNASNFLYLYVVIHNWHSAAYGHICLVHHSMRMLTICWVWCQDNDICRSPLDRVPEGSGTIWCSVGNMISMTIRLKGYKLTLQKTPDFHYNFTLYGNIGRSRNGLRSFSFSHSSYGNLIILMIRSWYIDLTSQKKYQYRIIPGKYIREKNFIKFEN